MQVLRTPDERFEGLEGYPFSPNYVEDGEIRIHYVDEGPRDGQPVLLLHGEPTWSYLYRTMIPIIVQAGYRAIAPDLVGFGRSDKPVERSAYTYQSHLDWMLAVVEHLDLREITLFGQDWGGLIGLRMAAENEDRFARIVAANTFLPTGDHHPGEAFEAWKKYSQEVPDFHVGGIVKGGCVTDIPAAAIDAYNAPFPDDTFKAGPRQFPMIVPVTPDDPASEANRAAWKVFERWEKPFLTLFSDSDPITRGGEKPLRKMIPGAAGQPHATIEGAGHFLQEDKGPEIAHHIVAFVASTT